MMYWQSWADFWAMGGYAPYVWPAFGLSVVLMVGETLWALRRRQQVLAQVMRRLRSESPRAHD